MKTVNILALALSALCASALAAPIFRNPQPVPMSIEYAAHSLVADFNGDGHGDLLMVNPATEIVVLLSNGTGPFAAPVVTALQYATGHPAVGDVNGDAKLDLVVTDWSTKTVAVLLGNGDGTFRSGSVFAVTVATLGPVALGHFNADAFLDVVVGDHMSNSSESTVEVYAGDGTGQFSGRTSSPAGAALFALIPVDVNGDSKTDLIGANHLDPMRALLGNGNGGFTAAPYTYTSGGEVATGDFNHDGKVDLAIADSTIVEIQLGDGDGTFTHSASYAAGSGVAGITIADVDEDGWLDLLVPGYPSGAVAVLRGKTGGTFHPADFFVSGTAHGLLLTGDFDRDGHLDLLTGPVPEIESLSFIRGNGDGTFRTYRAFYAGAGYPRSAIEDMNNDGKPDVVAIQPQGTDLLYDLAVLLNDGSGRLAPPIVTATGKREWTGGPFFAVGELNGDGKADAVVFSNFAYESSAAVLLGNGQGGFGAPAELPVTSAGQPVLGHFDGDSHLDIFVPNGYAADVYRGNGDGTFEAAIRTVLNGSFDIFTGDINGDGKLDFIATATRVAIAYLNDGTGHFTSLPVTYDEITADALGDFDGDGKLDLLFTTYGGTQVRFGTGTGAFGAPVAMAIQPVPRYMENEPVSTADFDGDGKLDVAFGAAVYLGNGDGTFGSRSRFRMLAEHWSAVADMDGSGSPDLVMTQTSVNAVTVLLTRTSADPTVPSSITLTSDHAGTAQYGEPVELIATVTGGAVPRSGVVRFSVGGKPVALIPVDRDGKATFTTGFALGSYAIAATYTGDENYLESSAATSIQVTKRETQTGISGGPNPTPYNSLVRIFAETGTSAGMVWGMALPTGTITIREGDVVLGTLAHPSGRVDLRGLAIGSHVITADYSGDANYEPSSASYTQVITKPVPGIGFGTIPASQLMAGTPVTLRAFFNTTNVTGTVSFTIDGVLVKTLTLVNGEAKFDRTFTWGHHQITIAYSGDDNWAPSQRAVSLLVYGGPWGTTPAIAAAGSHHGGLTLQWSPIVGANEYTIWRKTSRTAAWEPYETVSGTSTAIYGSMPANLTWLFAITAEDANGNASPMSAPDLATAVGFTDQIVAKATAIKALHLTELRAAIAAVRTFAGLPAFSYTNPIVPHSPFRVTDIRDTRAALAEARAAIGLPAIAFTDSVLTPGTSIMRAAHVNELRAGAN